MLLQTQLSVELTNVFGGLIGAVPWKKVLDLGRDLRKSGSDLVVEEDLANVFGRGKVVHALENQFKDSIKDTRIIPLHPTCIISLQSGPGPTVTRAMREQDRRYMSTVIQISFLGSLFNRTELATAIMECMSKRLEYGIQDTSGPGFEDVIGVLEACSSQTSSFDWQSRTELVEKRVRSHFACFDRCKFSKDARPIMTFPTHLLLAAMDYLYLAQSLPEDRKMFCKSERGLVPLVVWAHTILGLTIVIRSQSHEDLVFGNCSSPAQVIIHWRDSAKWDTAADDSDILLLDKSMKVILKTSPDKMTDESEIEAHERHNLQSFGSLLIYRWLNQSFGTSDDSPIYQELIEYVLALVIIKSRRIERQNGKLSSGPGARDPQTPGPLWYSLEYWRIVSAAAVIFHGQISKLDDVQRKDSMLRVEMLVKSFHEMALEDPPLPRSLQQYLEKLQQTDKTATGVNNLIMRLTLLVFIFSHVVDVDQCSELPICFERATTLSLLQIQEPLDRSLRTVKVNSYTIFASILRLLIGSNFHDGDLDGDHSDHKHAFLMSDFGWSVSLHCVGDRDPSDVKSHLICVRRGVPTNHRGERKSKIRDAEGIGGSCPGTIIRDEGKETYRPRCDLEVFNREEYYGSRTKEFWLSLRMDIRTAENVSSRIWDDYTSYRELHDALWEVDIVQGNICNHSVKSLETARLGLEIATFSGWGWQMNQGRDQIPQRICVCLTKGDRRARWLAIKYFHDDPRRRVLLRGTGCCEDCALDTAIGCPGEWILIL
jgi:hypothetical protein